MKILLIGTGSIGRRHLNNLITLGCNDIAILTTGKGTLNDPVFKNFKIFSDATEAFSSQPHAVIIANPTSLHVETAILAAQYGCHMFIEKPIASNLNDLNKLLKLTQQKNLITMIGCQFRFHPLLNSLREQLQQQKIGNILYCRAEYGDYLPNWHPWENYQKSYSANAALGGGVILTLIHPIDYLYWLFGGVKSTSTLFRSAPALSTNVQDDIASIQIQFESNTIAHVELDFIQSPATHQLKVIGDNGKALLDFNRGELSWTAQNGATTIESVPNKHSRNSLFLDEMKEFICAINSERQTCIPITDGIEALKIALGKNNEIGVA